MSFSHMVELVDSDDSLNGAELPVAAPVKRDFLRLGGPVAAPVKAAPKKAPIVQIDPATGQKDIRTVVVMVESAEGRQLQGFQFFHLAEKFLAAANVTLPAGFEVSETRQVVTETDEFRCTVWRLPRGVNTDKIRRLYEAVEKFNDGSIVPAQAKFLEAYGHLIAD